MSEPTNYTQSTLESKTIKELVAHALTEFDVKIDPGAMTKQKIIGYVLALQDLRASGVKVVPETGDGGDSDTVVTAAEIDEEAGEIIRQVKERRVRVIFNSSPEPGGNMPIKMSLNGRAYQVKRDVEVRLPESVFNACIRDAVQTIYEPIKDPVTGVTTVSQARDVGRFSYTILGYTTDEAA